VRQISLYHQFGWTEPDYIHLPLAVNEQGNKLSKQNHAPALPDGDPRPVLIDALRFLNQNVTSEWQDLRIDELLNLAVANWTLRTVPKIQHSQMRCAEL
jgi:glutamyl-Q tRNA(Asp) synthetase